VLLLSVVSPSPCGLDTSRSFSCTSLPLWAAFSSSSSISRARRRSHASFQADTSAQPSLRVKHLPTLPDCWVRRLAAFLYQVQSAVPFAVDALSYGASVAGLLFIKAGFQPDGHAKREPLRTEIREGVAWLWNHHLFRDMALLTTGINVVMSTSGLILIIIARNQHASPWMIGALFAAAGVGGIIGSAMAPMVSKRLSFGHAIIGTLWLQTVIWPLFALAPISVVLGLVNAALAFVGPTFNVVLVSYRLAHTPDPLQGRVNSAVRVMTFGGPPLGLALSGVLLQTVGAHPTVWIFAACLLLLAMAASLNPRVRKAQLLAPRPSA